MPFKSGAGELWHRVAFSEPGAGNDGAGGVHSDFTVRFSYAAAYMHLRNGESVMAGRLAGKHSQVVRVRATSRTRTVTTDWRLTDTKTGTVYNIRDITPTEDRAYLEMLCESGVAT